MIDLGNCNIKDEVVGHLSRTTWRRLERLDLGNMSAEGLNKISRLGMCELVKGEFPELFTLYLCKSWVRQTGTELGRRRASC